MRNLQTSQWNLTRPIFFQLSSTYETLALSVFSLLIHVSRCSPFHPFTFSLVHRFTYSPFHLGEKVKGGKPGFQKLAPCTEESYPLRNLETSQWNLTRPVPCKQGGRIGHDQPLTCGMIVSRLIEHSLTGTLTNSFVHMLSS